MVNYYEISLEELENSEIVHYSSEDILITSIGNKIKISKREESLIKLPIRAYLWVFLFFST